jgi:hypothetical protein
MRVARVRAPAAPRALRLVADQLGMGDLDELSEADRAKFDAAYEKL